MGNIRGEWNCPILEARGRSPCQPEANKNFRHLHSILFRFFLNPGFVFKKKKNKKKLFLDQKEGGSHSIFR